MATPASLYYARKHNRSLRNLKRFTSDIASPVNLGSVLVGNPTSLGYLLPANCQMGISFSAIAVAGDITVAKGSETLGTPNLAANEIHRLGYFGKNQILIPSSGIAGTVTVYVFNDRFVGFPIATGVFS